MRSLIGIAIVGMLAVMSMGQAAHPPMAYELYSWQKPAGAWNFCLVPSPSGVNVTAEQVFGGQCLIPSVGDLKRRISVLPELATVIWLDRFTGTGQASGKGGKLGYPPSKVVMDVKREAESRKIKLEMSFSAQLP
jgi:hypothetical protein